MQLQRLQNKVLYKTGNYPRRTQVRDLHMAFKIPYVYDYVTKLCMQQAEVIKNHDIENVRNIGEGDVRHRTYSLRYRQLQQQSLRNVGPGHGCCDVSSLTERPVYEAMFHP
jgi:hypothetical protein